MRFLFVLLLVIGSFFSSASAQTTITQTTEILNAQPAFEGMSAKDIAYAPYGGNLTSLDVYTPDRTQSSSSRRPVVFYIHGGWWKSGDKMDVGYKPHAFTNAGYVFVSANYRLAPKVKYPSFMDDLAVALYWVRSNIKFYGGDPDRIIMLGHSAGAQMGSLLAIVPEYLKVATMTRKNVCAIVNLDSNSYDIVDRVANDKNAGKIIQEAFGNDKDIWKEASPRTYFTTYHEEFPPFLNVYVSHQEDMERATKLFHNSILHIGAKSEIYAARGYNHATVNSNLGREGDAVTAQVLGFIDRNCGKPQ